jgi:arylsulfatase A-like enzyme
MEQAIRTVLQMLDDEGVANETIVLFLSDNGGDASSVGGADNAPLRGGKSQTFEGGIRVVAAMRWPAKLSAGTVHTSIMSVMDVFPTLTAAASVPIESPFALDGRNLLPALESGTPVRRDDYLLFASVIPIPRQFRFTAFDDECKLVQEVDQGFLSADVTNYLFRIRDDPGEHNNLAHAHPDVVERMTGAILEWRRLRPAAGARHGITPPPGWRAPLDWTDYPRPVESLQCDASIGIAPEFALPILDYRHGDAGRVRYDCEPYPFLEGGLRK